MNIFATSFNTQEAVSHLDDLRLNKMILETAQMLSSAYRCLFGDDTRLYKITHFNHPCSIWARDNVHHYSWLVQYFDDLAKEKMRRDLTRISDPIPHKSWNELFEMFNSKKTNDYQTKLSVQFFKFNCTEFKSEPDLRIAYRKQLVKKWQNDIRPPKWTSTNIPYFFDTYKSDK